METAAITGIISALLLYTQQAMHLIEVPFPPPEVRFTTQENIAAKACDIPQCDVEAWFSYQDKVIYLRDDRDIRSDMHARSILLHEIVHYVQEQIRLPQLGNACSTWKAREIEAHKIQFQWLYENHVRVKTPMFNLPLVNFDSIRC